MWAAAQAANKAGLKDGWRLVINDGPHGCIIFTNNLKVNLFITFISIFLGENNYLGHLELKVLEVSIDTFMLIIR